MATSPPPTTSTFLPAFLISLVNAASLKYSAAENTPSASKFLILLSTLPSCLPTATTTESNSSKISSKVISFPTSHPTLKTTPSLSK